jgi:hypothetical protein
VTRTEGTSPAASLKVGDHVTSKLPAFNWRGVIIEDLGECDDGLVVDASAIGRTLSRQDQDIAPERVGKLDVDVETMNSRRHSDTYGRTDLLPTAATHDPPSPR